MNAIGDMLGASARYDVLRALFYQHRPVGLRELARLAGVHPHSAERMLKELVKEGVVRQVKRSGHAQFHRNPTHPDWPILGAVFEAAERAVLESKRLALDQRAKALLPFMVEANAMLKRARRTIGVA